MFLDRTSYMRCGAPFKMQTQAPFQQLLFQDGSSRVSSQVIHEASPILRSLASQTLGYIWINYSYITEKQMGPFLTGTGLHQGSLNFIYKGSQSINKYFRLLGQAVFVTTINSAVHKQKCIGYIPIKLFFKTKELWTKLTHGLLFADP